MSDNGEIRIVAATLEDINGIRELTRQLCDDLGKKFNEERFVYGINKRLRDPIQKQGYLIAKKGEKVIGMVFAEVIKFEGEVEGFLRTVVVDTSQRGFKIGEEMIKSAIDYLKKQNIKVIRTNIHRQAKEAINLYKKFGFVHELGIETFKRLILNLS